MPSGSAGQRLKSAQPMSGARGGPPLEPQAKARNSFGLGCSAIGAPSLSSQIVARRIGCAEHGVAIKHTMPKTKEIWHRPATIASALQRLCVGLTVLHGHRPA